MADDAAVAVAKPERQIVPTEEFRAALIDAAPKLRAFARSLTGDPTRADDLVQDTIARAIQKRETFAAGTNMHAWLVTILRNLFYSEIRKRRREVEDVDSVHASKLSVAPDQTSHMEMQDVLRALQLLPDDMREALLLVTSAEFSYEETAEICGVAVGTIKSRISRARERLTSILDGEGPLPDVQAKDKSAAEISAAFTRNSTN